MLGFSVASTSTLLLDGRTPAASRNLVNFRFANGLVSMSATILSVGQYSTEIFPSSFICRTKWYFVSMCFDLLLILPDSNCLIQDWLSSWIRIGFVTSTAKSVSKRLIHCNSWQHSASATNSASVLLNATHVCFRDAQWIGPPPNVTRNPEFDFRVLASPAQSAST